MWFAKNKNVPMLHNLLRNWPVMMEASSLQESRIKNQESRILFFPILGPQGAYKDQHITEWKNQIKKTWHIL